MSTGEIQCKKAIEFCFCTRLRKLLQESIQLGTNIKRRISSDDSADSKRYQLLESIQILKLSTLLLNPSLALQSKPVRSTK